MERESGRTRPRLFYKILILCALLVSVVTLLVSTVLYLQFDRAVTAQNTLFIQDSLEKVSNSVVFMNDWATNLAVQCYYDTDISRLLCQPALDPQYIMQSRRRLSSIRMSSPYIDSIYVFNGKSGRLYSDIGNTFEYTRQDFYDPGVFALLDDRKTAWHLKPQPRQLQYSLDGRFTFSDEVYSYVLYENAAQRRPDDNAIVINISRKWLDNAIRSLDKSASANLLIVDPQGRVVYGGGVLSLHQDLSTDPAVRRAIDSQTATGSFQTGSGAQRQLITWVRGGTPPTQWLYLYRLPSSVLSGGAGQVQRATVLFSGLLLLLGLAGAVAYARLVYRPIGQLQRKVEHLESADRERDSMQQQELLRSLVLQNNLSTDEAATILAEHGMHFPVHGRLRMVLASIDDWSRRHQSVAAGWDTLPAALRDEAIRRQALAVDMLGGHVVVVLASDHAGDSRTADLLQALRQVIPNATLSCVIGPRREGWDDLDGQYVALKNGLSQRVFEGPGCTVHLEQLRQPAHSGYEYPQQKETQLCQLLLLRQPENALRCCDEMLQDTRGHGGNALQITLLRLNTALMELTEKLNSDSGMGIVYDYEGFLARQNRLEYFEQIHRQYEELFRFLSGQLTLRKAVDHKAIADRIIALLQQQYGRSELTIESFEEEFGLSGIHLSRIFRRYTGQSFADYLRRLRLEHARELILHSGLPVQRVAEQVGFAYENYFYRLFKKEYGMTPAEFRQRNGELRRSAQV